MGLLVLTVLRMGIINGINRLRTRAKIRGSSSAAAVSRSVDPISKHFYSRSNNENSPGRKPKTKAGSVNNNSNWQFPHLTNMVAKIRAAIYYCCYRVLVFDPGAESKSTLPRQQYLGTGFEPFSIEEIVSRGMRMLFTVQDSLLDWGTEARVGSSWISQDNSSNPSTVSSG